MITDFLTVDLALGNSLTTHVECRTNRLFFHREILAQKPRGQLAGSRKKCFPPRLHARRAKNLGALPGGFIGIRLKPVSRLSCRTFPRNVGRKDDRRAGFKMDFDAACERGISPW